MKLFSLFMGALFFLGGLGSTVSIAQGDSPLWERMVSMIFSLPVMAAGAFVLCATMGWLPGSLIKKLQAIQSATVRKKAPSAGDDLMNFNKRAAMLDARIGSQGSYGPDSAPGSGQDFSHRIDEGSLMGGSDPSIPKSPISIQNRGEGQ